MDRRSFLKSLGVSTASSSALTGESYSSKIQKPHTAPRAKNVIFLFMCGGASHLETFDHKPALKKYNGKLASEIFNNCLLYTSPSPRDVEESRMPSSA